MTQLRILYRGRFSVADTPQKQQQAQIAQVRDYISDAYAFVRGAQYNKTAANTTYEQLLDAAVDKIEGTAGVKSGRPNKLDRIAAIRTNLTTALDALKNTPPESWEWGSATAVEDADRANTSET